MVSQPGNLPDERIGHVIKRAEQALIARKSDALREFDLTVPQYLALFLLSENGEMSAAQLARRAMVTPQTMTIVLKNLRTKGLIDRLPSSIHHKVLVTFLTPAGRTALRKADEAAQVIERQILRQFTEEELCFYHIFLDRTIRALSHTSRVATE
jgi:DNA-binding MarR family transcriptional regulator